MSFEISLRVSNTPTPFAATYGLSLLPSQAHFDRYVLPLIPVLAVLAGRRKTLAVAALAAAVVPLWWSVADARSLTGRDPRLDAAAWIVLASSRARH